ncbi:MAG: DUF6778 family protein [Paenirhodobacter sp.]|uniref:DUF6778 family protein n=1 Tax=Paenirhodobacter sp. TaxID=1965326 RepID=UPI003D10D390
MQAIRTTARLAALVLALAAMAGCAQIEPATRAANEATALDEIVVDGSAPVAAPEWKVSAVRVAVPRTLHVSEANLYYPIADIVWRGEARGDRYAQVSAIFTEAAGRATAEMTEGRPVVVDIEVIRFHALTEKTRYTFGGTYGVKFALTVRDAETGAILEGPRVIDHGFPASGGQKAIDEESRGLTEKVVITQFLADYLHDLLTAPAPAPEPAAPDRLSLAE